jgi:hypothetical protein
LFLQGLLRLQLQFSLNFFSTNLTINNTNME